MKSYKASNRGFYDGHGYNTVTFNNLLLGQVGASRDGISVDIICKLAYKAVKL